MRMDRRTDGQTDRQTDRMTKVIVAFRSFVNAPKTDHNYPHIRPATYCIIVSHLIPRYVTNTGQDRTARTNRIDVIRKLCDGVHL